MDERKLRAEVVEHLAHGRKIMAVKRVRELKGWSLARSKDFVEEIEAHGENAVMPPSAEDEAQRPMAAFDSHRPVGSSRDAQQLGNSVEALVRSGNMIEAIKAHRQATGLGLADSKRAVEAIRDRLEASGSSPAGVSPLGRRRFADEDSSPSGGTSVVLFVVALLGVIVTGAALAYLFLGR